MNKKIGIVALVIGTLLSSGASFAASDSFESDSNVSNYHSREVVKYNGGGFGGPGSPQNPEDCEVQCSMDLQICSMFGGIQCNRQYSICLLSCSLED